MQGPVALKRSAGLPGARPVAAPCDASSHVARTLPADPSNPEYGVTWFAQS